MNNDARAMMCRRRLHELTPDNTRIRTRDAASKRGPAIWRECRECGKIRRRKPETPNITEAAAKHLMATLREAPGWVTTQALCLDLDFSGHRLRDNEKSLLTILHAFVSIGMAERRRGKPGYEWRAIRADRGSVPCEHGSRLDEKVVEAERPRNPRAPWVVATRSETEVQP